MTVEDFNKGEYKEGDKMRVTYLIGNRWAKSETFVFNSSKGKNSVMVTLERVFRLFDEKRNCFIHTITIPLSHISKIKNYK